MSLKAFGLVALATWLILLIMIGTSTPPEIEPAPIPSTVYTPITRPSTTTVPTPAVSTTSPQVTTTIYELPIVFPDTPCQEWAPLAVEAGWPADPVILHRLLTIAFRESRCDPTVTSRHEDAGLLQIHPNSWCRPNRYNEIGWLQAQGILDDCSELYDPLTNLRAARALYLYSEARGDAWRPWALTR